MKINQVLAFDIGGTKIAYAVVDRDGKIVNQGGTPSDSGSARSGGKAAENDHFSV